MSLSGRESQARQRGAKAGAQLFLQAFVQSGEGTPVGLAKDHAVEIEQLFVVKASAERSSAVPSASCRIKEATHCCSVRKAASRADG